MTITGPAGADGADSELTQTQTGIPTTILELLQRTSPGAPVEGSTYLFSKPDGLLYIHAYGGEEIMINSGSYRNLAPNASFERGIVGYTGGGGGEGTWGVLDGWTISGYAYKPVAEMRDGYGGISVIRLESAGAGAEGITTTLTDLLPSTKYYVRIWMKPDVDCTAQAWTTGAATDMAIFSIDTDGEWVYGEFVTDATPTDVVFVIGQIASGDIAEYDQLTISDLPSTTYFESLHAGSHSIWGVDPISHDNLIFDPTTDPHPQYLQKQYLPDGIHRQALINSGFQVNQRGLAAYTAATTPANSDDTYLLDMWVLLSNGNDIVDVSQESTIIPAFAAKSLKLEVETANKKFGIIQFIENADALKFLGQQVSLSFEAYTVAGKAIRNVRAAILSWDGAADTLTSDVVDAWGAEGTDPTVVANWNIEGVSDDFALEEDAWTVCKLEDVNVSTEGMTNLAVFIWIDDANAAVNDLLYISKVQFNEGSEALPWRPISYSEELAKCERFMFRLNSLDNTQTIFGVGTAVSTTQARMFVPFPRVMRVAPTMSYSAVGDFVAMKTDGTGLEATVLGALQVTRSRARVTVTVASGLAAGNSTNFYADSTNAAWLEWSAEL